MFNQAGFILNLCILGIHIFTCLLSLIILVCVIYHVCYNPIKQKDRVFFILCANIYPLTLVYTALMISNNTQTLLGDLYGYDFNSSVCIFLGYFSTVLLSTLYWTFVNQAFFRLCRIVYSNYIWLQSIWLYIIISPIEFILIGTLLSPVLFWHDIIYLPNERYCFVAITNLRSLIWLMLNAYGIPILSLSSIYVRITIFLRRETNNQILLIKQRQNRDLLVIRRIILAVGFLLALGIPSIILILIILITGQEHNLFTRMEFLFVSLSIMGQCLSMVFITPQLQSIVLKKFQHIRLMPNDEILTDTTQIRHNTTAV